MRKICALLAFVLFVGTSALAQDGGTPPDYESWNSVAQRAENATQAARASNTALEGLRDELAIWRATFLAAQDANQSRITTLRDQITALGPEPDAGESEPAELAARRAELMSLLANLEAPQRRAQEAYNRANGLIGETDRIIRERQTARLFELNSSPINPSVWPEASRAISATLVGAKTEAQTAWGSEALQVQLRANLVKTLAYLLVAFVLLLRGRIWMVRLTAQVQNAATGATAGLRGFLVSLGQFVLPAVGIYAFVQALFSTGLLGFRGQLIADGLVPVSLAFFGARWLALRLLPRSGARPGHIRIDAATAEKLRRISGALGLLWGGNLLLTRLAEFEVYSQSARAVLNFPFIAIAGYLLFRLGRILRSGPGNSNQDTGTDRSFRRRSVDAIGRILIVIGVGGPVAAAIGFGAGASAVVFPTVLSLGLLALVIVLAGLMRDIYALATGRDDQSAQDALIPILVSFTLVLASIPFFALIWGARSSDLSEIWANFRSGYQLGETRISPTDFLTFVIVFVAGYALTRLLQSTLRTSVLPKTSIDAGSQSAILSGLGYVGIFLAAVIAISTAGIDLSSLAIVAGALSVGIGFGLQNIVSNFVSGIILLIERPINEGDWIEVGGFSGTVRNISVRSTRIETFNRTDVIIPNADLVSGAVTNFTRGNLIGRAVVSVGVAYGSDTQKVQSILEEIASAHPLVSLNPAPSVHFIDLGADSLNFEIRAILRDVNFILRVKSDLLHEVVRRFTEEGIEIPFAQRDVWLRNPEVLGGPGKPEPKPVPE